MFYKDQLTRSFSGLVLISRSFWACAAWVRRSPTMFPRCPGGVCSSDSGFPTSDLSLCFRGWTRNEVPSNMPEHVFIFSSVQLSTQWHGHFEIFSRSSTYNFHDFSTFHLIKVTRCWAHEIQRVFGDRLTERAPFFFLIWLHKAIQNSEQISCLSSTW